MDICTMLMWSDVGIVRRKLSTQRNERMTNPYQPADEADTPQPDVGGWFLAGLFFGVVVGGLLDIVRVLVEIWQKS